MATRGTLTSSIQRGTTSTALPTKSAGRISTTCGRASKCSHAKLALAGSYHSFWLASSTDALYNAASAVLARASRPAHREPHVGQELDVQATFTPSPRLQLHGGYAHIFPGAFLKAATPGKSYSAPYVMVTTMVLGRSR